MLKRVFDLLVAATALLLTSPLLLIIAAWIKLDSSGPVFFCQERVGLRGRTFAIYKFRTMFVHSVANAGAQITVGADWRITPAGRFLRRYKLDELPQFFNVLKGEMSVVGPRPEVPRYVAFYPPETRDVVLSVRPGITDLASIEYRDENLLLGTADDPEAFYINVVLPAKLSYCTQYVQSRSLWMDFVIVGKTVAALLGRRDPRKRASSNSL